MSNRDQPSPPQPENLTSQDAKSGSRVDEEEFANLNGLHYTLDQLIGNEEHHRGDPHAPDDKPAPAHEHRDASIDNGDKEGGPSSSLADHASVALSVAKGNMPWTVKGVPRPGNKMFFAVVYLAPGCVACHSTTCAMSSEQAATIIASIRRQLGSLRGEGISLVRIPRFLLQFAMQTDAQANSSPSLPSWSND